MRRPGIAYAAALAVIMFGAGVAGVAVAGSGNDRVLKEEDYVEVFKKEGNGDKNYLYTITEFEDGWGRLCTVVSGDSEKTMALDCTDSRRGS